MPIILGVLVVTLISKTSSIRNLFSWHYMLINDKLLLSILLNCDIIFCNIIPCDIIPCDIIHCGIIFWGMIFWTLNSQL